MAIGQNPVLFNGTLLISLSEWPIPFQAHAKTIKEHLNLVRTMPDMIRGDYEGALMSSWYPGLDSNQRPEA